MLDDGEVKELVKEKGLLYSRKIRGTLDEEGGGILVEVSKKVNSCSSGVPQLH